MKPSVLCIFFLVPFSLAGENKYSKEKNDPSGWKNLERPFRMAKVNAVWDKARKRLNDEKLSELHDELRYHDKEESHLKQMKSEGKDKDGMYEAKLRNRLNAIMVKYSLVDPGRLDNAGTSGKISDSLPYSNDNLRLLTKAKIKDKKLQKLWNKAEAAGFSFEELLTLKEEFIHYQEKRDLLDDLMVDTHGNSLNALDDDSEKHETKVNSLRGELKSDLKKLEKLATVGDSKITKHDVHRDGFLHPRVTALWKLAKASNFSEEELDSLKDELKHFENRLSKLEHLKAEKALKEEQKLQMGFVDEDGAEKGYRDERIDHHVDLVEKHHRELQDRILARHSEL